MSADLLCPKCRAEAARQGRLVPLLQKAFVHVFFTVATLGVWIPFWFLLLRNQRRNECSACGAALQPTPQAGVLSLPPAPPRDGKGDMPKAA